MIHYNMDSLDGGFIGLRWDKVSEFKPVDETVGSLVSEFPPEWQSILWVITNQRPIVNAGHNLAAIMVPLPRRAHSRSSSFDDIGDELWVAAQEKLSAVRFVASLLEADLRTWVVFREKYEEQLRSVLRLLEVSQTGQLALIDARDLGDNTAIVVDLYQIAFNDLYVPKKIPAPATSDYYRLRNLYKSG